MQHKGEDAPVLAQRRGTGEIQEEDSCKCTLLLANKTQTNKKRNKPLKLPPATDLRDTSRPALSSAFIPIEALQHTASPGEG